MQTSSPVSLLLHSRAFNFIAKLFLALAWASFAYVHFLAFRTTHDASLLVFAVAETLIVAFYIFRSDPKTVSLVPFDWAVAIVGTFAALFFQPSPDGILPAARNFIAVGALIQIIGVLSLNRSFALVAAKREIKTRGMYRFVRHPIYAAYCVIFSAYVLAHTTPWNVFIYSLTISCLLMRIAREERHLADDALYRDYMRRVRYRVIPFVY
ncbi:MAG: methyltransferase family protein [Noviherbaspirillum sp.]